MTHKSKPVKRAYSQRLGASVENHEKPGILALAASAHETSCFIMTA